MAHHLSGGNHVVRDFDGLGLSGGSRREVIELLGGRDSVNVKIYQNKNAYGNLGLGFVPNQERLAEEGLRAQAAALLSGFIKSLITFGGGSVTVGNDNSPVFGKTNELGGL